MASYSTTTRSSAKEVIQKAVAFFGEGGIGLEATLRSDCCVRFAGGGGHVQVAVRTGRNETHVDLETREWDHQVRQFMREIAHHETPRRRRQSDPAHRD